MTTKLVLATLVAAFLPSAALAMCPGKSQKVVRSCAIGETLNPSTGHCEKAVNS